MPRAKSTASAAAMLGQPVEVKPRAAPAPDAAGVFLSPRLLDQTALDELAGTLRTLIDRAAAGVSPLREATVEAERTLSQIRGAAEKQRSKFEEASALLASLDARVRHVEEMLARATDSAEAVRRFEEKTDEVIAERVKQFASKLDSAVAAAAGKASQVECRVAVAAESLAAKSAQAGQSLRELCDQARSLVHGEGKKGGGGLLDLVKRGERLEEGAAEAASRYESLREQAGALTARLGESMLAAREQADALSAEHDRLRRALAESVGLCRTAQEVMGTRSQDLREALDPPYEDLRRRTDEATAGLRASLGEARGAADAAAQLLADHRSIGGQLRTLLERLEPWRGVILEKAGDEPPALPEAIANIVETMRADLRSSLARFAQALGELAAGAAVRARSMDRPE